MYVTPIPQRVSKYYIYQFLRMMKKLKHRPEYECDVHAFGSFTQRVIVSLIDAGCDEVILMACGFSLYYIPLWTTHPLH